MGYYTDTAQEADWKKHIPSENLEYLTSNTLSLYINLALHHVSSNERGTIVFGKLNIGQMGEVWWHIQGEKYRHIANLVDWDKKKRRFSSVTLLISLD